MKVKDITKLMVSTDKVLIMDDEHYYFEGSIIDIDTDYNLSTSEVEQIWVKDKVLVICIK